MRRRKTVGMGLIPLMVPLSKRPMNSMKKRYNGAIVDSITADKVILTKERMNVSVGKINKATFKIPLDLFTKQIGQPIIGMIV